VPWLSPKDMGSDTLRGTRDAITNAAVAESAVRLVPAGSVALVVRSGILERTLPISLVPFETTLNQDMKAVAPAARVDARWIAWGLRSMEQKLLRDCRMAGTTVASMETTRLMDMTLPLPPLETQRRIVDLLEDHLSRLNAGLRMFDNAERRLDSLVDALFMTAFGGRISPSDGQRETPPDFHSERTAEWISSTAGKQLPAPAPASDGDGITAPTGWIVTSLEAVTSPVRLIRYGILKPRVRSGGTVPYVEVKDLTGNTLAGKSLHRTSVELDSQFSGARLAEGDVLIAVRGSFERTALVPAALESANISRDVARIAPLPSLSSSYLHLWLQSPASRRYLNAHARGVAVKGVNIHSLRALPIVVPGRAHQDRIAAVLTNELDAVSHIRSELAAQRIRAASRRSALLIAAFDGRLSTGSSNTVEVLEEPRV
jgi:type I restriction enzyme, S subunit